MTGSAHDPLSVCMLGRPSTGKTTYLVALWAVAKHAGADGAVALRGPLPPATSYLDRGAHHLLGAEPVRRTNRDTGEDLTLDLLLDGKPFRLDQLDVAGETIGAALVSRIIPKVLHERVAAVDGLLLFVHPDDVIRPFTIPEAARLSELAGDEPAPVCPEPLTPMDDEQVREAAPTAVQLVDLLQIASSIAGRTLPVAVIVSAWDSVEKTHAGREIPGPREWLREAMPFLSQFLENHDHDLPSEVFGVSAQGGDYDEPGTADVLCQQEIADRVRVAGPGGMTRDLADPLRWLLRSRA